jgi:hypothetical protein
MSGSGAPPRTARDYNRGEPGMKAWDHDGRTAQQMRDVGFQAALDLQIAGIKILMAKERAQ